MRTTTEAAKAAKTAARTLALLDTDTKNASLLEMAEALVRNRAQICEANAADIERGRRGNMPEAMIDRLMLNDERIEAIAEGIRQIVALPDPIGEVLEKFTRPNGLVIEKVRVPMGLIGMIYEGRPNVTADAAALCFKAGSSVLLRGSSSAFESNAAIVRVLRGVLSERGLDPDFICLVEDTGRGSVDEMLKMREHIDLIVPRGGASLIQNAIMNSTVPVLETGTGNCHIYVDESAVYSMVEPIVINAKTQRTGVCNAAETLLVHAVWAEKYLSELLAALREHKVTLHGGEDIAAYCADVVPATSRDWTDEYLDMDIAVRVVPDFDAALAHIGEYSTKHTDCILTENAENARRFLKVVDSAVVNWNASTRVTDGFEFGFGAELGISTQKLHARGPMGLREICSHKYLVSGTGHVRP